MGGFRLEVGLDQTAGSLWLLGAGGTAGDRGQPGTLEGWVGAANAVI